MTRINLRLLKGCKVVFISIQEIEPSTTYVSTNYPISPFELRVRKVRLFYVVAVSVLGNKCLAHEDKDQHDRNLEDGLSDYMFQHG